MTRIATIDVGTNTAQLLVADVAPPDVLEPRYEEQRVVRLGEGVDASRQVGAAALERLRDALLAYRTVAEAWGARHLLVGATSASRDARNRDVLVDFVRRETGLSYEILTGEEEATWMFAGAALAVEAAAGLGTVVDVGGGSTEIVCGHLRAGDAADAIVYRCSLDVGSVRLTERFFEGRQPPRPEAGAGAEALIDAEVAAAAVPEGAGGLLIGAAGTARTLALVEAGVSAWEAIGAPTLVIEAATVGAWRQRLLQMTFEEVLALNPSVMQGRADVFPAGVLVLDAVMRGLGATACRVTPYGLRHGLALRFLRRCFEAAGGGQ